MSIGIAIIGAGLFGKDEYFPAIRANPRVSLKAIYSRSRKPAESLATEASVDAYSDEPSSPPNKSLNALLDRPDIEAVVIALPIHVQPAIIRAALAAGKHVLSEKPIAQDTTTAQDLISEYAATFMAKPLVWAVAENFRYIKPITFGVAQLKRLGGRVTAFQSSVHHLIQDGDPFYGTEWRKNPQHQGGFILDAGIHFLAGLRELLGAVGETIVMTAAFSTQLTPHLPPVDTLNGVLLLLGGASGTISLSFGTEFKNDFLIEVVTTNGSVSIASDRVTVEEKDGSGDVKQTVEPFEYTSGVAIEVEAFGKSIQERKPDPKQSPKEALLDLRLVEGLLISADEGGVPADLQMTLI